MENIGGEYGWGGAGVGVGWTVLREDHGYIIKHNSFFFPYKHTFAVVFSIRVNEEKWLQEQMV